VTTRGIRENSALALLGDTASKLAALAVIVISARFLSVGDFALLATGLAAAGLLGSFLDLGAGTLLTRDGAKGRAQRGALLIGLLEVRAPLALAALVAAVVVGVVVDSVPAALAVASFGVAGALSTSVLGLYRSSQDIRPEAVQRLIAAVLAIAVTVIACLVLPSATVILAGLAAATLVALLPLVRLAPRIADFDLRVGRVAALRRAAPIGLLALATVAYYRSGTIALAALADPHETAAFSVAASIAFGMLMVPNAVTTALLPRLSAGSALEGTVECTRRVLGWTFLVAVAISAAAAAVVPVALPRVVGEQYDDAGAPFAVLCLGVPLIAVSGVVGTSLLSLGRLRPLGVQVAASLSVNLVVLAVLVPVLGSVGAGLATVACEAVALLLLVRAAREALPGLLTLQPGAAPRPITASGPATPS
jgi:O-antigen/teichoic acid export membrane protein